MEPSIFRYILRHTRLEQIFLIVLTGVSMPFVYFSLEIPKLIINDAIGGGPVVHRIPLLGLEFGQVPYLLLLCFTFLALIILNGAVKYYINVYRGALGERMLRRFRYELYVRILRFPLAHFKRVSGGEIIPMITVETEPLGGFIGDAFALPAFQGGLLVTYLAFIFVQDPWLGLAAVALYPPQVWLIPKLQRKVNNLGKRRVQTVRKLSEKIGESVSGITEIHAHDTSHYERADVAHRLGLIYRIRFEIYRRKFFIKFLNNFLAQLTPFFFYSIGGVFVLQGDLTLGALVAVLAAYKDVLAPWKELLKYYQTKEDVRIKYTQVVEQFQPENMFAAELQEAEAEAGMKLGDRLSGINIGYTEDDFVHSVEGANFKIALGGQTAVVGANGSGKDDLARLMGRLVKPTAGRLSMNGDSLEQLPEAVTGRRIAYVGAEAFVFSGSVRDNLCYGLKHRPLAEARYDEQGARRRREMAADSRASGNTADDINADWIDYGAAGAADAAELDLRISEVLEVCSLSGDIFELGLQEPVDPVANPGLSAKILEARKALRHKLQQEEFASLVELFDRDRYNTNMSVAENLLFGSPIGGGVDFANPAANPLAAKALEEAGLSGEFIRIGKKLAEVMLDMFADVAPDSELFERFSFIGADDLPLFTALLNRVRAGEGEGGGGGENLSTDDRAMLMSLPFKLTVARHRLGLIDAAIQERLVRARKTLFQSLGEANGRIEFFDPQRINPAIPLQDNILFGRLAYGQAQARAKVGQLIRDTVTSLGVHTDIIRAGLEYDAGVAGSRLPIPLRRKLVVARCLLKRPDLLIVNGATSGLDPAAEKSLLTSVAEHMRGRGLIWVLDQPQLAEHFEEALLMSRGRVERQGPAAEVMDSAAFKALAA